MPGMGGAAGRLRTVRPFEVEVAGVRLRAWLNPCKRVALIEREGRCTCEPAALVAEAWLAARVRRFMGAGWSVLRGEGW